MAGYLVKSVKLPTLCSKKKFDFQPPRTDVEPAGKDRGCAQTPRELREEQPTQFSTVFHCESVNATLSGDSAPPSAGVQLLRKALNHKQLFKNENCLICCINILTLLNRLKSTFGFLVIICGHRQSVEMGGDIWTHTRNSAVTSGSSG